MHDVHRHLILDPPRQRRQHTRRDLLQRMGPVPLDDAVVVARPRERGPRHRLRARQESRRRLLAVARARDAADPDSQDLDRGAALHLHLEAQAARGRHEERLAGGVDRDERESAVAHRAHVDDERGLVARQVRQQRARQVQREQAVEADVARDALLGRGAQGQEARVGGAAAGVVDEDGEVDVVELARDGVEVQRLAAVVLRVPHDAGDGAGVRDEDPEGPLGERRLQLREHAAQLLGVAAVDYYVEALGGKLVGIRGADAVGGASDQGPGWLPVRCWVGIAVQARWSDVDKRQLQGFVQQGKQGSGANDTAGSSK